MVCERKCFGGLQVKKIGDEFWAHVVKCKDPKACTIVLRGASKDILNEVERNLQVRPHLEQNTHC